MMILVLGATGSTGGEVARQLIAAGVRPRLLVRDRERAKEFENHADIVEGDMANPGSALDGIEKLYLVATALEGRVLERKLIDAAKQSGVRYIVKLSAITAENPLITFAQWHAEIEKHLIDSGLQWTMLRPGTFMTNALLFWAATIKAQGIIYQPTGDGKYPSIAAEDVAAVAVKALTEPGHEGKGYTLTGFESMNCAEYAEVFSKVLNKPVKFVDVPLEMAREQMVQSDMPSDYVDGITNLMSIIRAGYANQTTDTFEQLMGRKPMSFADWVEKYKAAFV